LDRYILGLFFRTYDWKLSIYSHRFLLNHKSYFFAHKEFNLGGFVASLEVSSILHSVV
jgi:hypothetical protein